MREVCRVFKSLFVLAIRFRVQVAITFYPIPVPSVYMFTDLAFLYVEVIYSMHYSPGLCKNLCIVAINDSE